MPLNSLQTTLAVFSCLSIAGCMHSIMPPDPATKEVLLKIACTDFLTSHTSDGDIKTYSTYFIEDDPIIRKILRDWKGPISLKFGDSGMKDEGGRIMDAATGRRAKLIKIHLISSDTSHATVEVDWYSGETSAGSLSYEFNNQNEKWILVQKKIGWTS